MMETVERNLARPLLDLTWLINRFAGAPKNVPHHRIVSWQSVVEQEGR